MKLRGHHLFCTALFSGHGYDDGFSRKMAAAIKAMEAGETIELTAGADEICAACPNLLEAGDCALGTEDVLRRDRAALQVLGLTVGEQLNWSRAGKLLSALTEEQFQQVCGSCRWQREGLCSFKLLLHRTKSR